MENTFLCPECGGTEVERESCISPGLMPSDRDPWSAVLQSVVCSACLYEIPTHLARRWQGISPEAAQHEWKEAYRQTAVRLSKDRGDD